MCACPGAKAGTQGPNERFLDSRLRGNEVERFKPNETRASAALQDRHSSTSWLAQRENRHDEGVAASAFSISGPSVVARFCVVISPISLNVMRPSRPITKVSGTP
jgi:hypothetical protein